jgi:very-short-patch-repair endonuclease
MSNLAVFAFEGQSIRFVEGKPVANDVAAALGYSDPAKTVSTKVDKENKELVKVQSSSGRYQNTTVLNEQGVLQLVSSSRLPNAIDIAKRMGLQCFHSAKEQDAVRLLELAFSDANPIRQYSVEGYRIDLYLEEIRVAIECDERGHSGYDSGKESTREAQIKKATRCTFVRFNPDSPSFNIGDVILRVRKIEQLDQQFLQYSRGLCECMPVLRRSPDPGVAQWADDVFWEARDAYLDRDLTKYQECVARLNEFVSKPAITLI